MDKYEFRLTKGDFEMMWAAFGELKKDEKEKLEKLFKALEDALYQELIKPRTIRVAHVVGHSVLRQLFGHQASLRPHEPSKIRLNK